MTGFPFSAKNAVLADGYPSDDREALRSFAVLLYVRRFDLTCLMISVVHTISDVVSSNPSTKPLQQDERSTMFISTLTVPAEAMNTVTRDARGVDTACGEISAECRPARTVDFAV